MSDAEKKRKHGEYKRKHEPICKRCGAEFARKRCERYCSEECTRQATLANNRATYARNPRRRGLWTAQVECRVCGSQFTAYSTWARYCRDECKAIAKARQCRQLRLAVYGITQDDFERMRVQQNDRCRICDHRPNRPLDVDHCHANGTVRGLLCNSCNQALGYAGDDPQRLRRMAAYLEEAAA